MLNIEWVYLLVFHFCNSHLPDWPGVFIWPGWSSLTGEMISNCIGVSGATIESKESADNDVESDPKDPVLLVRFVGGRDCLKNQEKQKTSQPSCLSLLFWQRITDPIQMSKIFLQITKGKLLSKQ